MTEYLASEEFWAICQVIFIDLVLAGDNAIVVGMAAASVEPELRKKVIVLGVGMAVVLRIIFAAVTMQLMAVIGLKLAGGLLLLWVCWRMYRDLREQVDGDSPDELSGDQIPKKTVNAAILQVAIADISMSLDNVLAVAGVADGNMTVLVIGLALSVILMGVGASLIASMLQRHRWIGYLGLILICYVALDMIWRGGDEIVKVTGF